MIKELKKMYAKYLLKRSFRKKKKDACNFQSFFRKSNTILILVPENEEMIQYYFDIVKFIKNQGKEITLFLPVNLTGFFPTNLFPKLLVFNANDKTSVNLPTENFKKNLSQINYDIVMDLTLDENYFYCSIVNLIKANISVGLNKEELKDAYNLIFDCQGHSAPYNQLIEYLKIF